MTDLLEINHRIREAGNQTVISDISKDISTVMRREMVEFLTEEGPTLPVPRL